MIPLGYASAAFILTGAAGTEPFVTTIGLKVSAGTTGATFIDVANDCFDAYSAQLLGDTDSSLTLERCEVSYPAGTGTVSQSSSLVAAPGRRSSASAPINLALLVNKITASPGRKNKGRMFLPGMLTSTVAKLTGIMAPSDVAAYQGEIDAWKTAMLSFPGGSVTDLVVLHGGTAPAAPAVITNLVVSPKIGSLRRRLR